MIKKITIDELARMSQNEFSEIREKFAEHDGQFAAVQKKLAEHDGRFDSVERKMDDLEKKVLASQDEIITILRKVDEELVSVSSIVIRHEKRITRIEEKIGIAS